jgi:hypothetical protein
MKIFKIVLSMLFASGFMMFGFSAFAADTSIFQVRGNNVSALFSSASQTDKCGIYYVGVFASDYLVKDSTQRSSGREERDAVVTINKYNLCNNGVLEANYFGMVDMTQDGFRMQGLASATLRVYNLVVTDSVTGNAATVNLDLEWTSVGIPTSDVSQYSFRYPNGSFYRYHYVGPYCNATVKGSVFFGGMNLAEKGAFLAQLTKVKIGSITNEK